MKGTRPGVLMVTGAYFPELSGAGLQCRALVERLRDEVEFTVLTTTAERALPPCDTEARTLVYRVFVDPASWWSKTIAAVKTVFAFVRARRRFAIVHLHGFSQKSIVLVLLALLARKKIVVKLTSVGHDDPVAIRRRSRLAYWCYTRARAFVAVSPAFGTAYGVSRLPASRLHLIPNGVDLDRFRPAASDERERARRELGFPTGVAVVLFVGFFSREKRPDVLFAAWSRLASSVAAGSVLAFVGATRSPYYEVDEQLAAEIRGDAEMQGLADRLRFVDWTDRIELYHRAADVFVLPSVREGLPNALLEAMASGLACIATRLPGVTDAVIRHGSNGLLIAPDDVDALADALETVLADGTGAARLGCEARRTIESRFGLDRVAGQYLQLYRHLADGRAG